jgi:hypothetical protein
LFQIVAPEVYNHAVADSRIRRFILDHVENQPSGLAKLVARRFAISRQAANRHLARLVAGGLFAAEGRTRDRKYRLVVLGSVHEVAPVTPVLQEDVLWQKHILPLLRGVPENVRDICNFGFTAMLNNAKDHSGSATVAITASVTAATVRLAVTDEGIGIFRRIREVLRLEDERHAIVELAKGPLTTDPARHTGKGILYASRMFDGFFVDSGELGLLHRRQDPPFLIETQAPLAGTRVIMKIQTAATHTMADVLQKLATPEEPIRRPRLVVNLAQREGPTLVSRSQAQRLAARLGCFEDVLLDFTHVQALGPEFADEIFRVFRAGHPQVHLIAVQATEEVAAVIRRAEAAAG